MVKMTDKMIEIMMLDIQDMRIIVSPFQDNIILYPRLVGVKTKRGEACLKGEIFSNGG